MPKRKRTARKLFLAEIDGPFGHFGERAAEQGDSAGIILRSDVSPSENHVWHIEAFQIGASRRDHFDCGVF